MATAATTRRQILGRLRRQQIKPQQCAHSYFSTQSERSGPVTDAYQAQVEAGKIRYDEDQLRLSRRLDKLYHDLKESDAKVLPAENLSVDLFASDYQLMNYKKPKIALFPKRLKAWLYNAMQPSPPRGVYIFGTVGIGKSYLMDLFHRTIHECNASQRRRLRRIHFHEFMISVHDRIHNRKKEFPKHDALPFVALSFAQESRVLCFDEFQVTDIADAMILKRLFHMLWDAGVVVVATSNRSPDTLYEGGLNRSLFIPFIDSLKENLDCILMSGETDYRREKDDNHDPLGQRLQSYFCPSDSEVTRHSLESIFASFGGEARTESIPVMMGRAVTTHCCNDTCAWFDFMDLCNRPLGAADYLALCERFPLLIIDHVPQLNASVFNEARRFVTLVDAAYECKTRLVISSEVPLDDLLVAFQASFETQDGDEEIAGAAIQEENKSKVEEQGTIYVKEEGGSSSSAATTFVQDADGTEVEWSATGRIGVSLAQLSAVQDVSFSFRRAESRLAEMNQRTWGRCSL